MVDRNQDFSCEPVATCFYYQGTTAAAATVIAEAVGLSKKPGAVKPIATEGCEIYGPNGYHRTLTKG